MKNNFNISPKLNLALSIAPLYPVDINNNSPLSDIFFICSDEEKDKLINFTIKNEKIFFFFYLNRIKSEDENTENIIHKYMYDKEKIINIVPDNFGDNLSSYFYLVKLIEDDDEIINYQYDIEVIQKLDKIKTKGKFHDIIIAKIITKLIKNYESSDNYIDSQQNLLNEIKSHKLNILDDYKDILEKYKIKYNKDDLEKESVDKIYIHLIINVLLKPKNIEEKNNEEQIFEIKFIDEIDLENIELTKSMFEELQTFFNEEKDLKEYNIIKPEELYDEKIINYYYILCKYILKHNFYIYQINFLLNLRKNIINIINIKNIEPSEYINDSINEEKFKYVIDFLTDSDYYYSKLIKPKDVDNSLHGATSEIMDESISKSNYTLSDKQKMNSSLFLSNQNESLSTLISKKDLNQQSSSLLMDKMKSSEMLLFPENEDNYQLLTYKKIIMKKKNKGFYTMQLKELKNGYFIEIDSNNVISIYDTNYTKIYKKWTRKKEVKDNREIEYNAFVKNVFEAECFSKDNNNLYFLESRIDYLILNEINIEENNENEIKEKIKEENKYNCKQFFPKLNKYQELNMIISGNTGIFYLEKLDDTNALNIIEGKKMKFKSKNSHNSQSNITEEIKKENYRGAIKITDNIFAFVSNAINNNGKNKIVIFDSSNKNNVPHIFEGIDKEKSKYSFNIGNNVLHFVNIDENKKLLLCACKSYTKDMYNGILMINIEINNFRTSIQDFYDTCDFEVRCFCTIHENRERNFSLILVGGLEVEKRREMVRLYKISYDLNGENVKVDYIQDAVEDFSKFCEFDGMINSIIKPKKRERDIIISCIKGSNYLFNLPENDYYINLYKD